MLYESYLGEEIKSDASQFVKDWITRFKAMSISDALNRSASLLELWAAGLKNHISSGRSNFTTSSAVNVASIISNAQGLIDALQQVHPIDSTTGSQYAALINRINAAVDNIGTYTKELNSFDPKIGNQELKYYKDRDAAIARGDLDNPIVGKDLKAQIISQAMDPNSNLVPSIRQTIIARYVAPSGGNGTTPTGSGESSKTPGTPGSEGSEPSKLSPVTLLVGAVAAYAAYKALA